MPWMTMDVEEQKVRFVVAATRQEKSFTALCQEFGISRPTGVLWRERYQQAGLAGIAERSRRPRQSPFQTAAELEQWGSRGAATLSRLGSAQAAGGAGPRGSASDAQHHPSHSVAARSGARVG